jgi:stage IV sporulation protein FB
MRIHPVFWLVMAMGGLTGYLWETVIAFSIVLIHECGHAAAARRFGWHVLEIELLPFGGVARIDGGRDVAFVQEFIVIISGPLQHLWLPFLSQAMLALPFWGPAQHQILTSQNMALLLFNLLPVWPLDGGRLLHLFLERLYPYKSAYYRVLLFSCLGLVLFSIIMLIYYRFSVNLWVMIAFISLSIYKERQVIPLHFLRFLMAMSNRKKVFRMNRWIYAQPDEPITSVFSGFYRNSEHKIRIVGEKGKEINGKALVSAFFSGRCSGGKLEDYRFPADD